MQAFMSVVGISVIPALGLVARQFFKYRGSVNRAIEPFGSYLVGPIRYRITRRIRQASAAQFNLRRYCEHQLRTQALDLIVPSTPPRYLKIDSIYVPSGLNTTSGEPVTHSDLALGAIRRAQIIGEPGSGKTALVKRIFRDACAQGITSPRSARLPILVELKDLDLKGLARNAVPAEIVMQLIQNKVSTIEGFAMSEFFDAYQSGAGLLLLLDGLDEVASSDLEVVEGALSTLSDLLARQSPNNIVLVTMRSQLYARASRRLHEAFPETITIQPFSLGQMYTFLTRWRFKAGDNAAQVVQVFDYLGDQPTLRDMCANPLILAMFVADHDHGGSAIPETRSAFYRHVLGELLVYRRNRQVDLGPGLSRLGEQRESLLGRIALQHLMDFSQPANSVPYNTAVGITQEVMGFAKYDEAEAFLTQLSVDTGVFSMEREKESLRFMHLTFCEFFAALQCVEGGIDSWLAVMETFSQTSRTVAESRLAEVIVFSVALWARGYRGSALMAVENLISTPLLVRCYLESREYDDPQLHELVSYEANRLSDRSAVRDETWFRSVRGLASLLRDAERLQQLVPVKTGMGLDLFLSNLVLDSQQAFEQLFQLYIREDPAGAMRVAKVLRVDVPRAVPGLLIRSADEPAVLALFLQEALAEMSKSRLWRQLLAEAALMHPLVAKELQRQPPSDYLTEAALEVHRDHEWTRCWATRGTLYGQLLAIAASPPRDSPNKLRRVDVLAEIKPRRFAVLDVCGDLTMRQMAAAAGGPLAAWLGCLVLLSTGQGVGWAPVGLAVATTFLTIGAAAASLAMRRSRWVKGRVRPLATLSLLNLAPRVQQLPRGSNAVSVPSRDGGTETIVLSVAEVSTWARAHNHRYSIAEFKMRDSATEVIAQSTFLNAVPVLPVNTNPPPGGSPWEPAPRRPAQ